MHHADVFAPRCHTKTTLKPLLNRAKAGEALSDIFQVALGSVQRNCNQAAYDMADKDASAPN